METTYKTAYALCERYGWRFAQEYGEPGYGSSTTTGVILGNYWCRCDRVLKDDGTPNLHGVDLHYPRIFAALEDAGIELEWEDEWIEDEAGRAWRTQADSYSWQSSILFTEYGDILTPHDGLDAWLEEVVDNPRRALSGHVWSVGDLEEARFSAWNGTYENGWHPGQTDDPEAITREIRDALGDDVEIVFYIGSVGQFDIAFTAWTRQTMEEEE